MNIELLIKVGKLLKCHNLDIFKEHLNILENEQSAKSERLRSMNILFNILFSKLTSFKFYDDERNQKNRYIIESRVDNNLITENQFYQFLYVVENMAKKTNYNLKRQIKKGVIVGSLLISTSIIGCSLGNWHHSNNQIVENPSIAIHADNSNLEDVQKAMESAPTQDSPIITNPEPTETPCPTIDVVFDNKMVIDEENLLKIQKDATILHRYLLNYDIDKYSEETLVELIKSCRSYSSSLDKETQKRILGDILTNENGTFSPIFVTIMLYDYTDHQLTPSDDSKVISLKSKN